MKRVLVVGCCGAGKSTLALELGRRTGLPVVHLDPLYWGPGWVRPAAADWEATVRVELGRDRWILDGNYKSTLALRLQAADTAVFLDLPRRVCLRRVLARRLGTRPDPIPGCPERLTADFLRYVWSFRDEHRPEVVAHLDRFAAGGGRVVHLRSRAAARVFLDRAGRPR